MKFSSLIILTILLFGFTNTTKSFGEPGDSFETAIPINNEVTNSEFKFSYSEIYFSYNITEDFYYEIFVDSNIKFGITISVYNSNQTQVLDTIDSYYDSSLISNYTLGLYYIVVRNTYNTGLFDLVIKELKTASGNTSYDGQLNSDNYTFQVYFEVKSDEEFYDLMFQMNTAVYVSYYIEQIFNGTKHYYSRNTYWESFTSKLQLIKGLYLITVSLDLAYNEIDVDYKLTLLAIPGPETTEKNPKLAYIGNNTGNVGSGWNEYYFVISESNSSYYTIQFEFDTFLFYSYYVYTIINRVYQERYYLASGGSYDKSISSFGGVNNSIYIKITVDEDISTSINMKLSKSPPPETTIENPKAANYGFNTGIINSGYNEYVFSFEHYETGYLLYKAILNISTYFYIQFYENTTGYLNQIDSVSGERIASYAAILPSNLIIRINFYQTLEANVNVTLLIKNTDPPETTFENPKLAKIGINQALLREGYIMYFYKVNTIRGFDYIISMETNTTIAWMDVSSTNDIYLGYLNTEYSKTRMFNGNNGFDLILQIYSNEYPAKVTISIEQIKHYEDPVSIIFSDKLKQGSSLEWTVKENNGGSAIGIPFNTKARIDIVGDKRQFTLVEKTNFNMIDFSPSFEIYFDDLKKNSFYLIPFILPLSATFSDGEVSGTEYFFERFDLHEGLTNFTLTDQYLEVGYNFSSLLGNSTRYMKYDINTGVLLELHMEAQLSNNKTYSYTIEIMEKTLQSLTMTIDTIGNNNNGRGGFFLPVNRNFIILGLMVLVVLKTKLKKNI